MTDCVARRRRRAAIAAAGVASASDKRQNQQHDAGENQQRLLPAEFIHQRDSRAANKRNCPNEPAAVPAPNASERHFSGKSLPNAPSTILNEQPDSPRPMSTPADRLSARAWSSDAINREAERIQNGADAEHAIGSEAVGDRAGERLADAPQQILDGNSESEDIAAPVIGLRQRRQEKA